MQRGDFLGKPVDKRLQFVFRYQPWLDVLEWFAEHAELSLVLNAPPPGTFNYTDTREYTPNEAIDLLNGVLTGKGFTLVRRGRMLMVIDLVDGVPEGIVPTVTLDALDKRGRFELVTVEFDLGRPATFDRAMVQEQIATGQRIEQFKIEARIDGQWKPVAQATTVGYKRLLRFPAVTAQKVRLTIVDSRDSPTLCGFGLYKASAKEKAVK